MESLFLFDETTLEPLLRRGIRPNSDFRPFLDLGAERARFEQTEAYGTYSFATSRVDLGRQLRDEPAPPTPYEVVPALGLAPAVLWSRAAWLREALAAGGGVAPNEFPEWQNSLVDLETFFAVSGAETQTGSWERWAEGFGRSEAALHWGTIGWIDSTFYAPVFAYLERGEAPPEARAAVDLRHAYALGDWGRAASAADRLVARVGAGERWVDVPTLLDVAVLAYLRSDRPEAARNAYSVLTPRTRREPWDLRNRLLDALVAEAEASAPGD